MGSGVREPMGGAKAISHECNSSGNPLTVSRRGGEGDCLTREARIDLWIGLAHADQCGRSSGRAISGEGLDSHDYYAFFVGKGSRKPTLRPENGPTGANIYYLWRGKPQERPCGAEEQAV